MDSPRQQCVTITVTPGFTGEAGDKKLALLREVRLCSRKKPAVNVRLTLPPPPPPPPHQFELLDAALSDTPSFSSMFRAGESIPAELVAAMRITMMDERDEPCVWWVATRLPSSALLTCLGVD